MISIYTKINKYLKQWIVDNVTAQEIQTGYISEANQIDLRKSAILIEPRVDQKADKNIRWRSSDYQVKLWVMVMIAQSHEKSTEEAEHILGGSDDGSDVGLIAAMDQLEEDQTFRSMAGKFAQKDWRIMANNPLSYSDVSFGVSQTSSSLVVTATLDVTIHFEQEKAR